METPMEDVTQNLTERELEVLYILKQGNTNPEIAKILNISIHTAKAHVLSIITKLKARNRTHAAVMGVKLLENYKPSENIKS